jgi:hypothetical protein
MEIGITQKELNAGDGLGTNARREIVQKYFIMDFKYLLPKKMQCQNDPRGNDFGQQKRGSVKMIQKEMPLVN